MSSTPRCAAVIFDMDGLMIDSEPLWHISEHEVFLRVDIDLSEADMVETTGLAIAEVVQHNFAKFGGWNEAAATGGMTRAAVTQAIIERQVELLVERGADIRKPGLDHALAFFRERKGLPLAVASSSPQVIIDAGLKGLGLAGDDSPFSAVVSADGEKLGKPYPGVYLSAAKALGVEARRCLALEDSVNGTLAAKAACMKCISVPEDWEGRSLKFHIADAQLSSLAEIDEALWEQLWGESP